MERTNGKKVVTSVMLAVIVLAIAFMALFAMSPAITAKATPTAYEGGAKLDLDALQVGDVISGAYGTVTGQTITNVRFAAGRYSCGAQPITTLPSDWGPINTGEAETSLVKNGGTVCFHSNYSFDFYPLTENGELGTAWVVTEIKDGAVYFGGQGSGNDYSSLTVNLSKDYLNSLWGGTSDEALDFPTDALSITPAFPYIVDDSHEYARANYFAEISEINQKEAVTLYIRCDVGVNASTLQALFEKGETLAVTFNGSQWKSYEDPDSSGGGAHYYEHHYIYDFGVISIRYVDWESEMATDAYELFINIYGDGQSGGQGGNDPQPAGHTHDEITFTAWESNNELPNSEGNYYLTTDVTLSSTWNAPSGTTNLCLNGHGIKWAGPAEYYGVFEVRDGATLNLYDCSDTLHYFDLSETNTLLAINVNDTAGSNSFRGGYITGGNRTSGAGGFIWVENATFNMYGGTILGNAAGSGGAVYISENESAFNMYGGAIIYNHSLGNGGAIRLNYGATFTLYGGEIKNNYAKENGGAVDLRSSSKLNLYGGKISANSAGQNGGGAYKATSYSTINLSGAPVVKDNFANGVKDDVYLYGDGILNVVDPLTDGASVGVSMESGTGVFTSGWSTHMGETNPATIFISTNLDYGVALQNGEAAILDEDPNASTVTLGAGLLYVGGVDIVTAENYTVNGTGGGKAVLSETDGKLFLTLTDYVYEGPGYSYWGEGGGIDYRGGGTLTIILVGNSSITKADDSAIGRSHGIYFDNGTLTIDGTGSLTISFSSDRSGWKSNGIFNESGSFVMNGGTVVSNAGVGDESAGIYAGGGITFNGGTFTGNGNYTTDYESRGIYSGSITVNGGTVCGTAPLDNNNEARAFDGSVTINAGTLTAYGNPSFSWGVQCGANSTWTILAGDDEASATQVGGVDGNEKYVHIVAQSAGAHAHDYETVWTTDDVGHWHACVGAGDCDEPKADFGEHSYSDDISDVAYYTCSVCHYENATRKSAYEAQQQPPVIYVASVTKGDVTTEYTSFGEALNAWTADSTLTLLNDVTSDRINVTGGVTKTLDLNGKTITLVATNVNEQRVLCITGAGTTLNLIDSSGTNAGRLTGVNPTNDDGWSGAIYINSGSTVNMYGGTVTGNSTIRGAGVWIDGRGHAGNATFNMYGGLITGNTSIKPEGTLEAGYSIGGGGGVYVGAFLGTATSGEGQFNMYGGTITGNAGTNGDNVYVDYGVMNMVGGTIDGGFAHSDYVTVIFDANGGTGTMSDQYVKRGTNTQVKDNTYYDLYAVEQDGYAREGYILLGWNTQADGKGTKYAVGTDNVNFGEDTTLYAQWTPIAVACITVDGETTEYASLIEAYEACPEGGTIVLIADVDISNLGNEVYVTVEKDLNIDLHGHTLKFKYTPTSAQIILSGGHVLTIDNSVPEKGGVKGFIDVEDDGSYVLLRNCRLIFGKTALASTADINHIEPFFTVDNIDEDGFLSLIRPMTDDELVELTEELIDEIPDPPVNNDETKDAIDEARKVYDMLPEDKKEEVENRQKLFDAEDEYARLNNTKWSIKIRAKSTSSVDYTAYIDEGETIVRVYDVTLYRIGIENGVEQDPELAQPSDIKADATISVKLTVPDVLVGKNFRILHVHSADDHAFVEYTKDADGKHIVIKGIDRLSDFAFVALTSDLTPSGQGGEGQGNEGQGGEGQGEQGGQEEVPTVEPEPEITKEDDPTKENLPLVPQGGQGGEEGQGGQGEEGQSGQGGKDEPAKPTASVALEDTDPEDAVGVTVEVEVKTEVSEEVTQSENNVLSGSLQSDDEIAIVYEVKLIRTTIENGIEIREEIQPSDIKPGTVVVINMVIPEELRGKPFKLLHIHSEEDVKEVTAYTVSEDGTTLTVRVDRLSEFAFVGKKVADAEVIIEPNKISDGAIAGIVIGGSFGILFLGLLIFFLLGRKKNAEDATEKETKKAASEVAPKKKEKKTGKKSSKKGSKPAPKTEAPKAVPVIVAAPIVGDGQRVGFYCITKDEEGKCTFTLYYEEGDKLSKEMGVFESEKAAYLAIKHLREKAVGAKAENRVGNAVEAIPAPKFVLDVDTKGVYRYSFLDETGAILLQSVSYLNEKRCLVDLKKTLIAVATEEIALENGELKEDVIDAVEETPVEEEPVEEAAEEVAADEVEEEPVEEEEEADEGVSLKENIAIARATVSHSAVNKQYIADYLKEKYDAGVELNRRVNETKTGLPLADTHYAVSEDGKKCFVYVYEIEDTTMLLVKVGDEYGQALAEKRPIVKRSAFPKSKSPWYSVIVDDSFTPEEIEKILDDAYLMNGGKPAADEGLSLKESLAMAKATAVTIVRTKKGIADYLTEKCGDAVELNQRVNQTKTGLPLADTHYAVKEDGKTCFVYVYETNGVVVLLLRLTEEYALTVQEAGHKIIRSAFPKSKYAWFTVILDDTYTEDDIGSLLDAAYDQAK